MHSSDALNTPLYDLTVPVDQRDRKLLTVC